MPPRKYSDDQYVLVARNSDNVFKCPGCGYTDVQFTRVYNHYYWQNNQKDAKHPGLLREDKFNNKREDPPEHASKAARHCYNSCPTPQQKGSETQQEDTSRHARSHDKARDTDCSVQRAKHKADATQAQQAAVPNYCVSLRQLPKRCISSLLIHGFLQRKVSQEQLEAAAAVENCCSGAEAWLGFHLMQSIRKEARLMLHPDKHPGQDQAFWGECFGSFEARAQDLLNITGDTDQEFWHHLVQALQLLRT